MPNQWKQFSGAWTPTQQLQARGANTWPAVPGAPTIGTATAGNAQADVTFTAPTYTGYPSTITEYTVTSNPGSITATGTSSPITITGLTNDTAYTFTVTATNDTGTGPASAASNSVTPQEQGSLYLWGSNADGAIGQNNAKDVGAGLTTYSSPVQVSSTNFWKFAVSSGENSVVAISKTGKLYSWGRNNYGGLGHGDTVYRSSPTQVGALTNWDTLSAGSGFCLAVKTDGTLWGWGSNSWGNIFTNNTTTVSSPVQIGTDTDWYEVSCGVHGDMYSFATKTNGTLWSAGRNGGGQLGHNDRVNRSSPVQVGALTNWGRIATGMNSFHSIKTDGTFWSIGENYSGQLGNNLTNLTNGSRSSPIQIGSLTNWADIATGYWAPHAVKTDGTLWGWGNGGDGRGGWNDTNARSSPIQIGSLTDWSKVAMSPSSGICIKTDGTLWLWGIDSTRGDNTGGGNLSSPIQIGSRTDWAAGSIRQWSSYSNILGAMTE